MPWDPAQYLKFADHRVRPAIDLLNRVDLESPEVAYDLGAGTGNITEMRAKRWPSTRVIGVDAAANAGVIASRNGRATAVPMPRRKVRRGNARPVVIWLMAGESFSV